MKLTNINSFDNYLEKIGVTKESIIAIWEQGSYLEGLHDEFSDRDLAVIWEDNIPSADKRLKVAQGLSFDIHEIKDVVSIGQSFDMFSDGEFLFNIGHGTKTKETKWYEKLNAEKYSSDIEDVLMSISAVKGAKIYFQKDKWIDNLKSKFDLNDYKNKLLAYFKDKVSNDLATLEKSAKREDFLEFMKYLHKVLRNLQLIYLLDHDLTIISTKHFEQRFAKLENGNLSRLIREAGTRMDMNELCTKTISIASSFDVKKAKKYKA